MTETIDTEYISLLLSKVEEDLAKNRNKKNLEKPNNLLEKLKNSDYILRDLYLISKVDGLKPLSSYLLFILKKIETGEINFDNMVQYLQTDKKFIEKEIINYFKLDVEIVKPLKEKTVKEKIKSEPDSKIDTKTERKILIQSNKFKVGELDNELVTEEFNESDFTDLVSSDEKEDKTNYLEYVKIDNNNKAEIVFNLPEEIKDISELLQEEEEKINKEKRKLITKPELKTEEEKKPREKQKPLKDGTITPEDKEKETQEKAEKIKRDKKQHVEIPAQSKEKVKKEVSIHPPEHIFNETIPESEARKVYSEYESASISMNKLMQEDLDRLSELLEIEPGEGEEYMELFSSLEENSSNMIDNSSKMGFEVIAGLYKTIQLAFISSHADAYEVDKESITIFKKAIKLAESLIKGQDYQDYKKVIKGLENIRKTISEKKQEREKREKLQKEKAELERRLSIKYHDAGSREQLIKLKHNILEVEKTLKLLENIEGDYQAYEALRRLSSTFPHLKEVVNVSKELKIEKLAQLAEANYIFTKFLQNYRLDPLDREISEIYKYMIYNFKLIFLDKPTKDLDVFISYLNDPVKIFEQTKNKIKK
jgi:hypothetical protein